MELFSRRRWRPTNKCPQTNVAIVLHQLTASIALEFHKHSSLPLGQIRAFISFYHRAPLAGVFGIYFLMSPNPGVGFQQSDGIYRAHIL